jgi:hypothetical protein
MDCSEIVGHMKAAALSVAVVLISPAGNTSSCQGINHQLSSYEPKELLNLAKPFWMKNIISIRNRRPKSYR